MSTFRHTDELQKRRRRQAQAQPVWFTGSVILHILLFGVLIWFTPLREVIIPEPKKREPTPMTPRQLQDLADKIDDLKQNDLLNNVQDIIADLHDFEDIRQEMAMNYLEYADFVAETAAETIEKLLAELEAQQELALKTMESVEPELAKSDALQDALAQSDAFKAASDAANQRQQEVLKNQIPPLDTLDKALSIAQMAGMSQTADAIKNLLQNQTLAHDLQDAARKTNELARSTHDAVPWHQQRRNEENAALERAENRLADLQKQLQNHTERREKTAAELEAATAGQTDAREKQQQARAQLDAVNAREDAVDQEKKQAENNLKNTEQATRRADNQTAALQKRLEEFTASENKLADDVQKQTQSTAVAKQTLENRDTAIETTRQAAETRRRDMTPAQHEAKKAQEIARQLIEKARETAQNEAPKPEINADQFHTRQPASHDQLYKMDVVDLYDTAVRLEQHILETYRDVRATERAILANMSIQNARRLTDVASTTRPEINRELLRSEVRTASQLEQRKEAVAEAVRETAGIRQSVTALLDTVRQVAHNHGDFSVDLAVEWGQQMEEYADAVTAEGEEDDAADISELMRNAMRETLDGDYNLPHTGQHGEGEHGENQRRGAPPRPGALNPQTLSAMRGNGPPRSMYGTFHRTSDPRAAVADQIWAARTVGPEGLPASWLGLTTWYVIGPFPNPARANIDRKFPPETVVDLDATYEGKNGPISWDFYISPFPQMVTPPNAEPYGIWYGYTEIRFDRACDLWVAIGSDDKSKIWVNDFLVWESAPQHKPWRPHEGFRKLHFRQGVNRILYRCENGQHGMGWSFVINLNPEAAH